MSSRSSQALWPPAPVTDVACFYCSQVMSEGFLQTHLVQCDLVLEKCPNGCGVSIQRRYRGLHFKNECARRHTSQRSRELSITSDNFSSELAKLRSALVEERRLRHVAVDEWRQKYDSVENWNKKLVSVLAAFKETLADEQQQRRQEATEWRAELEEVRRRLLRTSGAAPAPSSPDMVMLRGEVQVLRQALAEERQHRERVEADYAAELGQLRQASADWQVELQRRCLEADAFKQERASEVETLRVALCEEKRRREQHEQQLLAKCDRLEEMYQSSLQWKQELQETSEKLTKEQETSRNETEAWKNEIAKLPQKCLAEDHLNKELDELRILLEEDRNKVQSAIDDCKKEVKEFKEFLTCENAMISGVWVDQLKRIDDLRKEMDGKTVDLGKSMTRQRLQLKDCEDSLLKREDSLHANSQKPGRLLWRISDVEKKMAEAKENDTSLHSPVFFSTQYGYKLRLEVHLNGLGQWKGRHMIVSLQVLEGDWDPLLPWPFSQKVSFTLRDQVKNADEANNLVKTLTAGRAKDDPAGLHLFIPHKTMQQHSYIRDDAMFLDVSVSQPSHD